MFTPVCGKGNAKFPDLEDEKMNVPKSECLTFALAGRVNAGKSTLLNLIAGQGVAITSPLPGTTTDAVEKTMELPPFGRVVFLDTAGIGDTTALWQDRRRATDAAVQRADIVVAVTTAGEPDHALAAFLAPLTKPVVLVVNQTDRFPATDVLLDAWRQHTPHVITARANDPATRDTFLVAFKSAVAAIQPNLARGPANIFDGLVDAGDCIVHVVPIDSQAPKGRLILPQVTAIRHALDAHCHNVVATEKEFAVALANLRRPPRLVVCDSQVVAEVMAVTPPEIFCTTYSILMARMKGGLEELAAGAAAIATLRDGDRVLIAEACTHHAGGEDIGRVKIPALLKRATGKALEFDVVSGRDFADDVARYRLVVHCGGCMATREQIRSRFDQALNQNVPVTNYGMCIAYAQGVLDRALRPFTDTKKIT